MFRVRCRMLSGLLVVIMGTCSPSPVRPVVAPKPGASPQAGGQVKLGDFIYTNYGTRDVRGKETQERDAGDFYFKGTFLRGNAGGEIRLKVRNVSGQPHNFSIPAQQLNRDIPPGGDRTEVLVTLPDSGGIRFFCK